MAQDERGTVIMIDVVQGTDGRSTIATEPIEMATSGWIGSKSVKYPASSLYFTRVENRHASALSEWHTSAEPVIEINISHTTRLITRDGSSRDITPGDLVRFADAQAEFKIETLDGGDRELVCMRI